jgi:hypothetical protein
MTNRCWDFKDLLLMCFGQHELCGMHVTGSDHCHRTLASSSSGNLQRLGAVSSSRTSEMLDLCFECCWQSVQGIYLVRGCFSPLPNVHNFQNSGLCE